MTEKAPYLLVGNGRLAFHLKTYFGLKGIPYTQWYRTCGIPFRQHLTFEKKILVLIPDDAIQPFILENRGHGQKLTWLHCSGSLEIEEADSLHPLMSFGSHPYDLQTYERILFVTSQGRPTLEQLLPELDNPAISLNSDQKGLYHAWASLAGNTTTFLWLHYLEKLETLFNIPRAHAFPFLRQITENIIQDPSPLTGPLARGDKKTIERHVSALQNDDFLELYQAVLATHQNLEQPHENR